MAKRPAGRFDAFRLARERGVLEGSVDAAHLPRLNDRMAEGPSSIAWRIDGTADASGRPALTIDLTGEVSLECQRCLGRLAWPVSQQTELLLAHDDAELARLDTDSEAEVVLAQAPLDPLTLVEDELVLALPFAPRHPEGECQAPDGTQ
jgi:DUF177 domain-containing protein